MDVSKLIALIFEHRNNLEKARNSFFKQYRTVRFNDKSAVDALGILKKTVQSLLQELERHDRDSTEIHCFIHQKRFLQVESVLDFLRAIANDISALQSYQNDTFTFNSQRVKGDVSKFQALWNAVDNNILRVIKSLEAMETDARQYVKIKLSHQSAVDELSKPIGKIRVLDIRPVIPQQGETLIVLQRNAKDNREPGTENLGALTLFGKMRTEALAKGFFNSLYRKLGEQKTMVDVQVIASSAKLITPEGLTLDHMRAADTAKHVIIGLVKAMRSCKVPDNQLLNNQSPLNGNPLEIAELKDLMMFEQSPAFVKFLLKKHGVGSDFWINYERDQHSAVARRRGVEGQNQIADRIYRAILTQVEYAQNYHRSHPGRRLILWIVSHYDAISPFIKKHVLTVDMNGYFPIDYIGGIVIKVNKAGRMDAVIGKREWVIL